MQRVKVFKPSSVILPHKQQKRYSQAKTEPSVPDYQTLADRIVWTLTPGTLARTRDGLGEMQYRAGRLRTTTSSW